MTAPLAEDDHVVSEERVAAAPSPGRSAGGLRVSPRLQVLLIAGVALGGIVCMAVTVLVLAANR